MIDFVPSVSSTNPSVRPPASNTNAGSPRDSSIARAPLAASRSEVLSAAVRALRLLASSVW